MSSHRVDVIRVGPILPHPNADKLEMTKVGEYTCLIPKGQYREGDLAAYIEPDYIVPDTEQFSFLGGHRRIGAKRLRGVWSEGLLISAPAGAAVGDDVMQMLGIERYEPPPPGAHGGGFKGPPIGLAESVPEWLQALPKYDLENLKKYHTVFEREEPVYVTEKLHGTNARYCFDGDRMYCGSRTQWRKDNPVNVYWEALKQNPWVEEWCRANPRYILYGEVFGAVQDLTYGAKPGQYFFRVFDVMHERNFWHPDQLVEEFNEEQRVPLVSFNANFDMELLKEMAEHPSRIGLGIREGLVVKPMVERFHPYIGRVALKLVSNTYLSR